MGTEHYNVFQSSIKESDVKAPQASNYSGDLQEWKIILKYALLHQRPEGSLPDALQGLETVASVKGKTLEVTFRKNISGIVQRLGSIKLVEDNSLDVSPFDWVDTAVATSDDLRTQLESLQSSVGDQQDQVAKLTRQLDDLVKAKKEHEGELFKNFTALLNAKKLKIRDQQRMLARAKVSAETAEEVSDARGSETATRRRAGGSRRGKRKPAPDEEDDADVPGEAGDHNVDAEEDDRRQEETPPRSDDEVTEDDDNLDVNAPTASSPVVELKNTNGDGEGRMDIDESQELPPRRELPFKKSAAPPANSSGQQAQQDDEDETDEEL